MQSRIAKKFIIGIFILIFLILISYAPGMALLGDINLDDLVNQIDLDSVTEVLGLYQSVPGFDRFVDLNIDNYIDVEDLAIAGRSYGSTRNFHYPRRINNSAKSDLLLSSCIDGSDRIHIIWSETSNVFYTRLDRFGNTLIDDLLLENGGFAGNDSVAIGCDEAGNSHMIWDCADSVDGTCQARIDQYGHWILFNKLDAQRRAINYPDIDIDSSGNAHIFFSKDGTGRTYYDVVDASGKLNFAQEIIPRAERYHELEVDQDDNVHLLYAVYTNTLSSTRMAYQRIGSGEMPSLAPRTIAVLGWEGGYNDIIRPSMAVDSGNNVFASYFTFSKLPEHLYLEKLDQNGVSVIDGLDIFPEYDNGAHGGAQTDIALDSNDHIHMVSYTDFKAGFGAAHTAYGIFDNEANALEPMRMVIYDEVVSRPTLLVDSEDDALLIYKAGNTSGYPPCDDYSLCFQGTSFEANTYNLTLPDLGADIPSLWWDPFLLRWNESFIITGTVFNAGWYTSTETTVQVNAVISDTIYELLDGEEIEIPPINPYESYQFHTSLVMPFSPPHGFEGLKFLRIELNVDPNYLIEETTESNNFMSVPAPIEPIPTETRLYMVVRDDTFTVVGGSESAELVNSGSAAIEGPDYPKKQVDVTNYSTILAEDIPIGNEVVTYTVNWKGENYRTPSPVEIGVKRNISDPYKIDFTPMNTAEMVTDRWANLSGTISKSDGGGGALSGAKVRILGQGLNLEATTDINGNYSSASLPALGKMIPGEYQVRISRANYARLMDTINLASLEAHDYDRTMTPTIYAYLHGNVINEFGNPIPGAKVVVCESMTSTDDQGIFDMEVEAGCTSLEISREDYKTANEILSMTAGLETLVDNFSLEFDPPVYVVGGGDRVASKIIDVSTGGMLPDAPADAGFALTKLYEKFKDEFWIDYRILVLYGCYEYNLSAAYSGGSGDYQLKFAQVRLAPRTFEIHMSLGSVDLLGVTIPIPIVSDSGLSSALYAVEMRLVNSDTGQTIKTVHQPIEGGGSWVAFDDTTKTYDFKGASFTNTSETEVWLYLKVGLNKSGSFDSPIQLSQFNQQILKLNLNSGDISGTYKLGDFPLPRN